MKKYFLIAVFALLACGARAASSKPFGMSYVYWAMEPVGESLQFCYAVMVTHAAADETESWLTVGDTGNPYVSNEHVGSEDLAVLPTYSKFPGSMLDSDVIYLQLFDEDDKIIGVTQEVTYGELVAGGYTYDEMSTGGVEVPYHFSARTPEPTVGLLLVFGLGVLALRRRAS